MFGVTLRHQPAEIAECVLNTGIILNSTRPDAQERDLDDFHDRIFPVFFLASWRIHRKNRHHALSQAKEGRRDLIILLLFDQRTEGPNLGQVILHHGPYFLTIVVFAESRYGRHRDEPDYENQTLVRVLRFLLVLQKLQSAESTVKLHRCNNCSCCRMSRVYKIADQPAAVGSDSWMYSSKAVSNFRGTIISWIESIAKSSVMPAI